MLWLQLIFTAALSFAYEQNTGFRPPLDPSCGIDLHQVATANVEELFYGDISEIVNEEGVLHKPVKMTPETLLAAYAKGIFPYNTDEKTGLVEWVSKPMRGILNFEARDGESHFKVPSNIIPKYNREVLALVNVNGRVKPALKKVTVVRKKLNKATNVIEDVSMEESVPAEPIYKITFDTAFRQVMEGCREMNRKEVKRLWTGNSFEEVENHGWIKDEFIENYTKLYEMGYGHSVEVWEGDTLVAGIYGVLSNGYFSAESTFRTKDYVSQYAMIALVSKLQSLGYKWMDTQVVTNMSHDFGAQTIPRADFGERLSEVRHGQYLPWNPNFESKLLVK